MNNSSDLSPDKNPRPISNGVDFDYNPPSNTENLRTKLAKKRPLWRMSFLDTLLRDFSSGERLVLYALSIILGISTLALLAGLNAMVSVTVPAEGGSLTEGEVGPARFINPVLTLSQPDEDLSELVFSGLTRVHPDGSIVPDLASHYEISPDGTTYTFTLRTEATFHDGTPLTAADVLFTVAAAQTPDIKSPHRADWEGVQVSSPDPYTVVFKLQHAYAPFIENTTLGILPKHIWQNVSTEEFPFNPANTHPIGSGPYQIAGTATDATGSPTRYDLVPFAKYVLGEAYLKRISFVFYPNQEEMIKAFESRKIDAIAGIAPSDLKGLKRTDVNVVHVALPRVFGVFFNQSHASVLADASARAALDEAIDKQQIVNTVLGGDGVVLGGPIPPGVSGMLPAIPAGFDDPTSPTPATGGASTTPTKGSSGAESARAILSRGGWTFDEKTAVWEKNSAKGGSASGGKLELSFTLSTADEPELVATAGAVATQWRAAGIKVAVQVYPLSELNTNVIRPRAYDAVLFGEVVGRTADLFAFWHSTS